MEKELKVYVTPSMEIVEEEAEGQLLEVSFIEPEL